MRLIDADALIKELSEMNVKGEAFTTAVNFAKICVENAPNVIPSDAPCLIIHQMAEKCMDCRMGQKCKSECPLKKYCNLEPDNIYSLFSN